MTSIMLRLALPLLLMSFLCGCSDTDAEKLRRVGDKTLDRVTLLANTVSQELGQTLLEQKPVPAAPSIVERVTQRIRWDRELGVLDISVTQREEAIVLGGMVKSEAVKLHAQELAERTLGVQKVLNEMTVEESNKEAPKPDAVPPSAPAPGGPN